MHPYSSITADNARKIVASNRPHNFQVSSLRLYRLTLSKAGDITNRVTIDLVQLTSQTNHRKYSTNYNFALFLASFYHF
ncbi:hypothetical protein DCAR_0727802 [Daucus carota subsp. sativus]|uniref:Uncharacterized protein n=1 Tax=Daucus carota subsp. sativus TaxID=79200 RepID=A0A164T395_DAUCS|nr:hypothetical protein DCAR_0727802 [Daucus carota subsp. sativus]